ncbi:MAG TPA: hypothetical protein PLT50_04430, partial [bacterium]|nr:hypothetical protein [bacterium]
MLKNLTNGSIQFPSADPISNKAKIIAGGLGSGLGLGLGVYARQKLREQAVEKGMENFYNKHNQLPIAPPTQQTKTAELLKIASEDAENEAKLAFVYEVMEDSEIGQEVTEEVEYLLREVEESLEKNANFKKLLGHPALGLGAGLVGGAGIGYGVKKKMDESDMKKKDKQIQALGALSYNLLHKNKGPDSDFRVKSAG